MTLLNATQAVPSAAILIYRFLLRAETGIPVDQMAAALAPAPLQPADETTSIFRGTLRTCEEIGLIAIESNRARLHPDLPEIARDPDRGEVRLRHVMRNLILDPRLNEGDIWEGSVGMRDFTRVSRVAARQRPL